MCLWPRLQGQRSVGQGLGIKWKVLPEGIHMWNMNAQTPLTMQSKVMTKVKVFKKIRSNAKVKDDRGSRLWYEIKGLVRRILHMWNMKDLAPTNQKLWQYLRFKFSGKKLNPRVKG
jgi:hypothetical protein